MAQQPKPTPTPTPTPRPPEEPPVGAAGAPQPRADEPKPPLPEAKPDPSMETIADEQRRRSDEIAAKGVNAWVAEHDERSEEEKRPHAVEGVAHRKVEAHELRR